MSLTYVVGDATEPQGPGKKVIVHCCNNIGAWGAGFVLALSRKWPEPEWAYRHTADISLGTVQYVRVEKDIIVANLVGQEGVGNWSGPLALPPVRYDAFYQGLTDVWYNHAGRSVHMPRMGAGLAGGNWTIIEEIIKDTLVSKGMDVTVYDLP